MPSLLIALALGFQLAAQPGPESACITDPMDVGAAHIAFGKQGFKPTVTVKTPLPGVAGEFWTRPDGAWAELWLFDSRACLVDGGTAWTNIANGQTARPETPAEKPKGPETPLRALGLP